VSATRQWQAGVDRVTSRRMNTKSMPVVTATTDIAAVPKGVAPFTGQVIFNLTDYLLYRYDGTNWVGFDAAGGGFVTFGTDAPSRSHEARYFASAAQAIATATDTKIQFPSVFANSSSDVTPSGVGNTDFVLNRDGVWFIAAGVRYLANVGGNERHLFLQTGTSFDVTKRFGFESEGNCGNTGVQLSVATTLRATAGTSIFAAAFQNSGSSINTDPLDAATVHGAVHFVMTWLRPL